MIQLLDISHFSRNVSFMGDHYREVQLYLYMSILILYMTNAICIGRAFVLVG